MPKLKTAIKLKDFQKQFSSLDGTVNHHNHPFFWMMKCESHHGTFPSSPLKGCNATHHLTAKNVWGSAEMGGTNRWIFFV
jgi:hypothetical protein